MARSNPRIDLGLHAGKPITFSVDDKSKIEASYGRKLTSDQWTQIAGATTFLTVVAPATKSSTSVPVVAKKLQKLLVAAKSIREELTAEPLLSYSNSNLKKIYTEYFDHPQRRCPGPHELSWFLLDVVNATIAISEFTIQELSKNEKIEETPIFGLSESEIWSVWIKLLTGIMIQHTLPYHVRKDTDKRKGPPSPFVRLVRELQNCVPFECRKFTQSDDALAQSIYRARHA
jgi:hypothetical protein